MNRCCGRKPGHFGRCLFFCSGCSGTGMDDTDHRSERPCPDCDGVGWFDDAGELAQVLHE